MSANGFCIPRLFGKRQNAALREERGRETEKERGREGEKEKERGACV